MFLFLEGSFTFWYGSFIYMPVSIRHPCKSLHGNSDKINYPPLVNSAAAAKSTSKLGGLEKQKRYCVCVFLKHSWESAWNKSTQAMDSTAECLAVSAREGRAVLVVFFTLQTSLKPSSQCIQIACVEFSSCSVISQPLNSNMPYTFSRITQLFSMQLYIL